VENVLFYFRTVSNERRKKNAHPKTERAMKKSSGRESRGRKDKGWVCPSLLGTLAGKDGRTDL